MDKNGCSLFSVVRTLIVNQHYKVIIVVLLAFTLPCYADRGGDAYKLGERAERQKNLDAAYSFYKQAHALEPGNAEYFAAYTRMRFTTSTEHLRSGQTLRNTGALTEALAEFRKAVEIDASSFVAQQELRLTADMIRRKERQQAAPDPPTSKLGESVGNILELQPLSESLISIRMAANADVIYKTIGKIAGLNVLIDPEYRPQRISVDLTDVTVTDALDMLHLQSKTFWRPVLPNTIFITVDSANRRKELEQSVMKTFYLRNITTPAELQEAGNLLKQMLDVSRVQLVQAQDALIVRGTPDQMLLAEKLLADYDKPKSEVIIDVAVMQVTRDRMRTLGTVVPTTASIGPLSTSNGSSSGGSTTAGGGYIAGSPAFALAVAGGSFTALASDGHSKILQNPEIRALNNEKSTIRIGDRVPIATGSFQPGIVGGGGVSPLVSTQFQYLDVGVNIDILPHIHSDREVTLKMALEISSVTGTTSIGGITQPIIGQRRIDHETRLVDGEVNLLGGILEDTETQSLSGYPWLSKIPILKYLFGQENRERQETEIIFAITPHIVRAHEITAEDTRAYEVGTGSTIELRRRPAAPTASAVRGDEGKPQGTGTAPGSQPAAQQAPAAPQKKGGGSK
jgi:general secretion pathway protein D